MKKICALVILITLTIFLLTGCFATKEFIRGFKEGFDKGITEKDTSIPRGEWDGYTYRNEHFDLTVQVPEYFIIAKDAENKTRQNESDEFTIVDDKGSYYIQMNILESGAKFISDERAIDKYWDAIIKDSQKDGNFSKNKREKITLDGNEYETLSIAEMIDGYTVTQQYLVRRVGNYYVQIRVTCFPGSIYGFTTASNMLEKPQ